MNDSELIQQSNKFHSEAMDAAFLAFKAQKTKKADEARKLFLRAYELEYQAASLLGNVADNEPNRSIFFRSAAWLAFHAGKYREAERMAACGLMGNPPDTIVKELREVMVSTLSKLDALTPAHAA